MASTLTSIPAKDYQTIYDWRTGRATDRGVAASAAAARLSTVYPRGFMGHESFDALAANRLDLSPAQVRRLVEHGRWPNRHPPRASAHGQAVLGEAAPAPWRITRAPRAPVSSSKRRGATPASAAAYRRLQRSTLAEQGAKKVNGAVLRRYRGARDSAVFALLYVLGLKAGEVAALRVGDYDPVRQTLTVGATGHRPRTLPTHGHVARALDLVAKHRPRGAAALLPSCDRGMTSCAATPTASMVEAILHRRWTLSAGADESPVPSAGDLRAALERHLQTSPGVPTSGVDWVLGRRVRRKTPFSDREMSAMISALGTWEVASAPTTD